MRALVKNMLLNPPVLLAIGLVFPLIGASLILIGASLIANVPVALGNADRLIHLQPLSVTAPGGAAFVEGRISERTPTVHRQFVAYLLEVYYRSGPEHRARSHWVEVNRETPPLLIETRGSLARVSNDDYHIETTDITVEEAPPTFTRGAVQSRGFVKGSPVLAVGAAVSTEELVAEFLYAGTRDEYLAYLRRDVQVGLRWGGGLLLAGIGCLVLSVGGWRRFLRGQVSSEPGS